ncbi:autotransporter outer membrane beta-barrel domain-containing protein [Mailhella sp.]|uniref:autotransporter outer membrane beta-barrel domain-containing protein n=1 Tax=Mailhella sp. TaxID=1981029 RepID=UPI0040639B3E
MGHSHNDPGLLTVKGKLKVEKDLTLKHADVTILGNVTTKNLDATNSEIHVGGLDKTDGKIKKGTLIVTDSQKLKGSTIFIDPEWSPNPAENIIENASHFAQAGGEVSSSVIAARNSLAVLGDSNTDWAISAFHKSNAAWEREVTAAIAIAAPQVLESDGSATGSLLADGSLPSGGSVAAGDATFNNKSLLLVKGSAASGGNTALTGSGTLTVAEEAKLYISDAKTGVAYNITDGFAEYNIEGWTEENLLLSYLVKGDIKIEGGKVVIGTEAVDAEERFPNILPHNAVNKLEADIDSSDMGVKFLSRATDPTFVKAADVENTINEASRPSITAGVQNTALRIADMTSSTVLGHLSLGQHDGSQSIHSNGVDFWAAPMYGNLYTSGMNVAGSSLRGQFGGLALGADMEAANVLGGKMRVGAAINGGGGQSEAKGTVCGVQNDYGFGAFNLYANWNKADFNVMASVGYNFGNHDIDMYLPAALDMGKAKADIDTSAITADLRAEYQLKTRWVDVLPHAGVRYTALRTDSHDLKVTGSVLNSSAADTQHIVQFPVGVTLSKDFTFADWNVKPMADVSVIPAVGDKDMNSKLRFSGVDAVDSFDSRIMDSTSWAATVGVQAEKGKFTFGLNYGVQTSSHETDQNVQVKLGWKF